MTATDLDYPSSQDPSDEISRCRDLVVLVFQAVLHRKPEEADAAAFTNALLSGMPIYDFVSELMGTPEFREPVAPITSLPPVPRIADATLPELMSLSLALLQARLTDKGCHIQLGPASGAESDQEVTMTRMQRMVRTLAMLNAL